MVPTCAAATQHTPEDHGSIGLLPGELAPPPRMRTTTTSDAVEGPDAPLDPRCLSLARPRRRDAAPDPGHQLYHR